MGISFASVVSLIQVIAPAIQTAEQFIRGRGRGAEKREAVVNRTVEHITEIADEVLRQRREAGPTPISEKPFQVGGNFNWSSLLANIPELMDRVGAVVDALVGLFNFLRQFEVKESKIQN